MAAMVDFDVEMREIDKRIESIHKKMNIGRKELIRTAGRMFCLSASKISAPSSGKTKPAAKGRYRGIMAVQDNPESRKKIRTRYKVPYRTMKKRGVFWAASRREAKGYAFKAYYGTMKLIWLIGLYALKITPPHIGGYSPDAVGKATELNYTNFTSNDDITEFSLTNMTSAVPYQVKQWAGWGLRKTKNQLRGYFRRLERQLGTQI